MDKTDIVLVKDFDDGEPFLRPISLYNVEKGQWFVGIYTNDVFMMKENGRYKLMVKSEFINNNEVNLLELL